MEQIEHLELTRLPIGSEAFAADPLSFLEAARAGHPWLALSDAGYVVTDYAAMKDILSLDDKLKMSVEQMIPTS